MLFIINFVVVALVLGFPVAFAGYDVLARDSISVYWGQNAFGQANNSLAQQRLSHYCQNSNVDLIPVAFLTSFINEVTNFASATDVCESVNNTDAKYCSQIEQDIIECQQTHGKTILLSLGGETYKENGFPSDEAAVETANKIWASFGPPSSDPSDSTIRPFGKAIVDGFDLDIESPSQHMKPFANQLRSLMNAATGPSNKRYYMTAAPQCVFPDKQFGPLLDGTIPFDAVMVQFYNNVCGADSFAVGNAIQERFNFATWDSWAKNNTANPNIKVILGLPGGATGARTGYVDGDTLKSVINYSQSFSSFGGVMIWDMTQIKANQGYLKNVINALGTRNYVEDTLSTGMTGSSKSMPGAKSAETEESMSPNTFSSSILVAWLSFFLLGLAYL